jgi:hypothetical protein
VNSDELIMWFLVAAMVCAAGVGLRLWWVAERDERRWRRRVKEAHDAAMIRQHRYGDMAGGTRHDR